MGQIVLPKGLHPDFSQLRRKPAGDVFLDESCSFYKDIIGAYCISATEKNLIRSVDVTPTDWGDAPWQGNWRNFTGVNNTGVLQGAGAPFNLSRDFSVIIQFLSYDVTSLNCLGGMGRFGWLVRQEDDGKIAWLKSQAAFIYESNRAIAANEWVTGCWTVGSGSSANHKCYLDGILDNSTLSTQTYDATNNLFTIGADTNSSGTPTEEYKGKIAAFIIVNRELTEAEGRAVTADLWGTVFKPATPIFSFPSDGPAPGFTLPADAGSYAITGQDANLEQGRLVGAEQGSYSITGFDANLVYTPVGAIILPAEQGSYSITGFDATLTYVELQQYLLQADAGSYAITGQDANFIYSGAGKWIKQPGTPGAWVDQPGTPASWVKQE